MLLATLLLPQPVTACEPEPASQYAPAGFICAPMYGTGTASAWQGPGAARNDCVWPWLRCVPVVVTALATGRSITVTPSMWCMCWVQTIGPNGETERIIDLAPDQVRALGLDPSQGLWRVRVDPFRAQSVLP